LGNENTRFFHTKATINYRHNYISMLRNKDLAEINDHDGKADILWEAFKEKMGKSDNPVMHFNLHEFFGEGMCADLREPLEAPFSKEEIDEVVKGLPNEKSPGLDGFNNEFIKNCWHIIREDIVHLIQDIYDEKVALESINSSFITLIPKIDSPIYPSYFRPISLLKTVFSK
jgi:hypothetical protein